MKSGIKVRRAVERLTGYRPPREGRVGKLRMDFNENTVGCAPQVVRALQKTLNADWLASYPEYEKGRQRLARHFRVSPDELVLANGTDDAIQLVCNTFLEPGDLVVVPAPTFPVYEFFAAVAGAHTIQVRYDEKFRLPMDSFLQVLKRKPKWVALANPNNPTGTLLSQDDLKAVLEAAPRTLVLVDEAYFEFAGETVLPWIRSYSNLIVTRTFSKVFGLAGLRMGCLFAHPSLTEPMRRCQNPFAVSSLALAGALEAIKHGKYVQRYVAEVLGCRAVLCRTLDRMNVPYVASSANFVLTRMGPRSPAIAQRLRAKGILVRNWDHDPRLQGYLRFTVGNRAQTRRLLAELGRLEPGSESQEEPTSRKSLRTGSKKGRAA